VAIAVEGPRAVEINAPLVLEVSYTGLPGRLIVAPIADREKIIGELEAAGAVAASDDDYKVVRLENGRPRYGEDISERYLAQETNQLRALHFSKGCYLGQEIVERVRSRAQIHRVLMRVEIEGTEPPAPGTKLGAAEITSAAYSPALGKVVALAYVRSEFAKPGAVLDGAVVR
jgi:folate-binding protein YgfZ